MSKGPRIAIFPGMFDPITNGHLDVIRRGRALFDRLVIAIGQNPEKKSLFTVGERLEMVQGLIEQGWDNVEADTYQGLTVDYARQVGATVILRGLRNMSDLNYEFVQALTNRAVGEIETVFVMTGEPYALTSSTLIKQIAAAGEVDRLHRLLPPLVLERLKAKKAALGERMTSLSGDGFTE